MYFLLVIAFLAWNIYLHLQIKSKVSRDEHTARSKYVSDWVSSLQDSTMLELSAITKRLKANEQRISKL